MTNKDTIETAPGKFEGERMIVQAAYEQYLQGFADEVGTTGVLIAYVAVEGTTHRVAFVEDEQGFICEVDADEVLAAEDRD